ncbi:MAG: FecR domain-containing protein, partial [Magnetococcus sp. WYHC-3]
GDGRNPQPATPCELRVGDMLRQGDRVVVGKDGKVGLKYDGESTTIEMLAATEAAFGAEKGAKRVRLDGGKFVCSAAPQKMAFEIRTRHATARVVGTRFSLDVTAPRTVLAVMEGKVDLIQGEKVLEVEAGASATVTDQGMEMTPTVTQTTAPMRSGCVWAWGRNQYGQLGDGTTVNKSTPVQVAGLSGVTAVAAGKHHTVALKSDGSVWAWGNNRSGQLGDGTRTDHQTPVPVKTADGTPLRGVAAIAAGAYNTVALKSDGRVLVWGDRLVERAGLIHSGPNELPGSVQLNGITAIAAGVCHMLALRSDDTVWTWGLNDHGQLGDGTKTARIAPVQVKLPDGTPLNGVIAIAAGGDGSMALRDDGTVWTWGIFGWSLTPFGQLVNGTETLTPVQVKLANGSPLSGIIAVTAGQEHAVALKNDGTVWAWGGNRPGQLGDGTKTYSRTPVQVKLPNGAPLSGVSAIAAGGCETTALLNDRTVWEWGSLGLGEPRLVPVQVKMADGSPLSGVITMASSDGHTVVVGE